MFIIFIFRNECKLRNETNRTQSKTTTKLKTARMATEGEGEVDGEGRDSRATQICKTVKGFAALKSRRKV